MMSSDTPTGGSKRGLWSKMSRTMRGMKIGRTLKNTLAPKKISNFDETLIAPGEEEDSKYATGSGVNRSDPYVVVIISLFGHTLNHSKTVHHRSTMGHQPHICPPINCPRWFPRSKPTLVSISKPSRHNVKVHHPNHQLQTA